jgi:hypothetical protein
VTFPSDWWRKARKTSIIGRKFPLPDGSFVDGGSAEGKRYIEAFLLSMYLSCDPYWQPPKEKGGKS